MARKERQSFHWLKPPARNEQCPVVIYSLRGKKHKTFSAKGRKGHLPFPLKDTPTVRIHSQSTPYPECASVPPNTSCSLAYTEGVPNPGRPKKSLPSRGGVCGCHDNYQECTSQDLHTFATHWQNNILHAYIKDFDVCQEPEVVSGLGTANKLREMSLVLGSGYSNWWFDGLEIRGWFPLCPPQEPRVQISQNHQITGLSKLIPCEQFLNLRAKWKPNH